MEIEISYKILNNEAKATQRSGAPIKVSPITSLRCTQWCNSPVVHKVSPLYRTIKKYDVIKNMKKIC